MNIFEDSLPFHYHVYLVATAVVVSIFAISFLHFAPYS